MGNVLTVTGMHAELRQKLRKRLRQRGVDVYIACTPSNVHYTSGFQSSFIDLSWQMTGTDLVVVPAFDDLEPAIIVSEYCAPHAMAASDIGDVRSYSMWTEGRDLAVVAQARSDRNLIVDRPEQYDSAEIFGLVKDVLRDRGLDNAVIGSDLALMKHSTFEWLLRTFPGHDLVDCEDILYEARRIKHPGEIDRLRCAASLFDAGVSHAASLVVEGQSSDQMRNNFEAGVAAALASIPEAGTCQGSFFFPHVGVGSDAPARSGDIIKLDCGVKIDGYWSDGCRHFCLGKPSANQRLVHDALKAGFDAALPLLRPGAVMKDIYDAALAAVRYAGLPNYSRGHFGHSIGMDDQTEEPPFIGPNRAVLEAGMVVCLEVPYYPADIGGFNIEDMFVITDAGHEALTHLPRDLIELSP